MNCKSAIRRLRPPAAGTDRTRDDRGGITLFRVALAVVVAVAGVEVASGLSDAHAGLPGSNGCPADWQCRDIGSPAPAGGQSESGGTWTMVGGGSDIWNRSDAFHFAWGRFGLVDSISARVRSQTDSDQNAKAGVMVRSNSSPSAAYYDVLVTPKHGLVVQFRTLAGQAAADAGGRSLAAPAYVEVVRSGTTFTAFTSTDGTSWSKVSGSTKTVPGLSGVALAGLAVTSHDTARTSTATFDSVQVASAASLPVPPPPTPTSTSTSAPATTTTTTSSPPVTTPSTTTTSPPTGTTTPTATPQGEVSVCGTALCVGSQTWSMYGSTVYNPGLQPYRSGMLDPAGTVALAQQAHLNTIRITDFLDVDGSPSVSPYDPTAWDHVDAMIAAAGAAGLHVDLGLADYRATLWNNCIDPYTADWSQFVSFVANRVNTVTHVLYKDDPTIAFVSVAGEPLPVGTHTFTSPATGQPCSLTYTTDDLTSFYSSVLSDWSGQGGTVLINSGGLGYLNESGSGIDWRSIFSLPTDAFCDIKTYGGMQAWAPTAAAYCISIGKPVVVEEFGWQQDTGDAQRALLFSTMVAQLRAMGVAGMAFWNLGYQLAPTSYEVNPSTPDTFAAVAADAP